MSNKQEVQQRLISMGFQQNYITRAFKVYDRNYGDSIDRYNTEFLTEIIIKLKQKSSSKPSQQSSHPPPPPEQAYSPRAQQLLHLIKPNKYNKFTFDSDEDDDNININNKSNKKNKKMSTSSDNSFKAYRHSSRYSMDTGEHQWMIDAKLLKPMITAKNQEKFISPKFKMSHLTWQIEAYPNGNTPTTIGSFNLYLRLISMPVMWKNITICRTFLCEETKSGYTAVSKYEKNTSLGWPDFNLSLNDVKNRIHWIKALRFTINIKILQIKLHKNDGEIFYENAINPYKALKKQTITWKLDDGVLHEMKQAYHKKGFVSPIYNNMWTLRCYPNGKTIKGDFLIQLQLCGLPIQASKLNVDWKINCVAASVAAGWTTKFDYAQSCWGWGNNQLSFEAFKKCDKFEICVEIKIDDEDNIKAMAEWEKYVIKSKQKTITIRDIKEYASSKKGKNKKDEDKKEEEPKDDHMIGITRTSIPPPPQNMNIQMKPPPVPMNPYKSSPVQSDVHNNSNINEELSEWVEKRLKIQDDILEELTKEIDQIKNEIDGLSQSDNNGNNQGMRKQIQSIQRQLDEFKRMKGNFGSYVDDEKDLNDKEKVEKWLSENVKLPQYFELFIEQGFDDLEAIKDITKEDLNQMGVDKVGHQRKIIKHAEQIRR